MFFVLCEEERKVASFFFGCGAPFLADVSYLVTFEFLRRRGRKGGENLRAKSVKMDEIDRRALNEAVDTRARRKKLIMGNVFLSHIKSTISKQRRRSKNQIRQTKTPPS